MNVEKLYSMQAGLDRHIEEKHDLISEDLFDRKMLALLVELGELANETRCFKFWSLKPASDKSVILEEFVDGIHFILSLGLEAGFRIQGDQLTTTQENSITEQFLKIYGTIHAFRANKTAQLYDELFKAYLALAVMLGFTEKEIEQAYIEKNEVNYERQQNGY